MNNTMAKKLAEGKAALQEALEATKAIAEKNGAGKIKGFREALAEAYELGKAANHE